MRGKAPVITTFGKNMRRVRRGKEMSQDALARGIGRECNTISTYEVGRSLPDVMQAAEIANKLGVSLDMLCETEYYKLNREKFHNPLEY